MFDVWSFVCPADFTAPMLLLLSRLLSRLRSRWLRRYGEQRGGRNLYPDKNGHFELFRDEKASGSVRRRGEGGKRLLENMFDQSWWHGRA